MQEVVLEGLPEVHAEILMAEFELVEEDGGWVCEHALLVGGGSWPGELLRGEGVWGAV
jgi:hypothetical protein